MPLLKRERYILTPSLKAISQYQVQLCCLNRRVSDPKARKSNQPMSTGVLCRCPTESVTSDDNLRKGHQRYCMQLFVVTV